MYTYYISFLSSFLQAVNSVEPVHEIWAPPPSLFLSLDFAPPVYVQFIPAQGGVDGEIKVPHYFQITAAARLSVEFLHSDFWWSTPPGAEVHPLDLLTAGPPTALVPEMTVHYGGEVKSFFLGNFSWPTDSIVAYWTTDCICCRQLEFRLRSSVIHIEDDDEMVDAADDADTVSSGGDVAVNLLDAFDEAGEWQGP